MVVNPGAWTHYSYAIRDALELFEAPVVEVHLSNIDEREDWRRHSVIADVAARRIVGKGPDGYREALGVPGGAAGMTRVERLQASLEEPLLVTNLVNVRYLDRLRELERGARSSSPTECGSSRDFRYAELGRAVEGVEFVETKRVTLRGARRAAGRPHRLRGRRT